MKLLKSSIKIGDKEMPIDIQQFGTLDEAINREGYTKVLSLANYAYSLFQRAKLRRGFVNMAEWEAARPKEPTRKNVKGNLRGMTREVKSKPEHDHPGGDLGLISDAVLGRKK